MNLSKADRDPELVVVLQGGLEFRNKRRILIHGNGHFSGFALIQLEHFSKEIPLKP